MKRNVTHLIIITTSLAIVAMDKPFQQKKVWIQTTDKHILAANPNVVKASNLLTILKQHKNNGSYDNPIPLPINAEDFNLFRVMHMVKAGTLRKTIANNSYYQLIDAAEKLKALKTYVNLIRKVLPKDPSVHITHKWIPHLIHGDAIRQQCTGYSWATGNSRNGDQPKIYINNDGKLFAHDVSFEFSSPVTLCNTEAYAEEYQFNSSHRHPLFFSPNGNYIISKGSLGLHLYNILTKQKYQLLDRNKASFNITISDDGKYILNEGLARKGGSTPTYKLWAVDAQGIPQLTILENGLEHSYDVLFHPDNEHILHTKQDLYLYNIATHEDRKLTDSEEKMSLTHRLTFCPGKTHMLCDAHPNDSEWGNWKALIKVKDYTNITPVILPLQSFHQISYDKVQSIAPQYIPHKNLVTHIALKGKLLNLFDENATLVASHTAPANTYISALAADPHGDYLATGYSDGTITIWDLSDTHNRIRGKKLTGSHGVITKLTFTYNQLLLSQSQYGEFWETDNPTATPGTAILWDVYGNQILNFGNSIVNSKISQNGKKIVVIDAGLYSEGKAWSSWRKYLTITSYNIDVKPKACTLKQALELLEKNEEGITPKYCFPEYPIHIPKKSSSQTEPEMKLSTEPSNDDIFHTDFLNSMQAFLDRERAWLKEIEGFDQMFKSMQQNADLKK